MKSQIKRTERLETVRGLARDCGVEAAEEIGVGGLDSRCVEVGPTAGDCDFIEFIAGEVDRGDMHEVCKAYREGWLEVAEACEMCGRWFRKDDSTVCDCVEE